MAKRYPHPLAVGGRHLAPALVLTTAFVGASLSFVSARSVAGSQVARRFDRVGTSSEEAIRARMNAYVGMLRASAGLVAALGRPPTAAEFHAHVATLDPERDFPGIQGIGFALALRPAEAAPHERSERMGGRPDYRMWPEGHRDLHAPVVLLEPLDWRNRRTIGFDMYSEPVRREAMERARDTGAPAASGRVDLVQEVPASRQAGFLVYLPVYTGHGIPPTLGERRARILGWVHAPFRAGDLLQGTVALPEGAALHVFDGPEAAPGAEMSTVGEVLGDAHLVRLTRVDVAGRTWTLRLESDDDFVLPAERHLPRIVGAVGAAIALLLFWITWRETQARSRAERIAVRNAFLADAGHLLAASFDYSRTLDDVVRLAAGQVADGAVVYLDEVGDPLWIVGHRSPGVAGRAADALRGWRPNTEDAVGPAAALRAGTAFLVRPVPVDEPPLSRRPELVAVLRDARVRAALTVPLVARGEPLGAIVFLSSRRFRSFRSESIALAEDLARLVVSAVESARLFRRAQDAVRSRDEFLSIASHELKTPITSLALQADSLRASAQRGDTGAFARKVEVIRRNVRRLSGLVSSMLDLSRIQAGRLDLDPEDVDLAEVTREVVSRFEDEAQRAHAPLRLDAPEPVWGRWDRLRLDQVLTNLVSNALKYGRGQPVYVAVAARGELAVLSVRDLGIGIAPVDQPRIFERFERAVSDRHYGGFGLGLWIVREVVAAMGGRIRLESTPGQGSTFTVELERAAIPIRAEARGSGPGPSPERAGPGHG